MRPRVYDPAGATGGVDALLRMPGCPVVPVEAESVFKNPGNLHKYAEQHQGRAMCTFPSAAGLPRSTLLKSNDPNTQA